MKNYLLLFCTFLFISCGSTKGVSNSLATGSLVGSLLGGTSASEIDEAQDQQPTLQSGELMLSAGADRQIIKEEKVEDPQSLLIKSFVSISHLLSLKVGQSYNSIVSKMGNPYDLLHEDSNGSVVQYYYKTINSIFDENTENIVGGKSKKSLHDSSLRTAYLHFDSSDNLVKVVSTQGFSSSSSVLNFNEE
tara:strand:- start:98 stop:670 length:573 start_codon:yes stop_codon:yes gene_type:complete